MQGFLQRLVLVLIGFIPIVVNASTNVVPIEGYYQTIDDKTGRPKAKLKLVMNHGALEGQIVEVNWQPGDHKRCVHCQGKLQNQPIVGMKILWGLHQTGAFEWRGGYILDPHNGRIYRAQIKQDGRKLSVRAYLGAALFGRSQQWFALDQEVL